MSSTTRRAIRAIWSTASRRARRGSISPTCKRRGAVVVWTAGDPARLPEKFAAIAAGAAVQPPFTLADRRGPGEVRVGWAILQPIK